MDEEIRTPIGRGQAPDAVIREVGRQYKVDEFINVKAVEARRQYDPGIPIIGIPCCSKGSGRAVASFVSVATRTTVKKPEAQVGYLKLKGVLSSPLSQGAVGPRFRRAKTSPEG